MIKLRVLSEDLPLAKVHPTYRDRGRLDVANTQLNYDSVPNIMPLIMDMNNIKSDLLSTFREIVTDTSLRKLILINNAGVCLEGNTRNILQESLDVNCLSPVSISELLIEEFSNPIRVMNGDQLILINISSGDGELTYLHTDLAKNISGIKTFMVSQVEKTLQIIMNNLLKQLNYCCVQAFMMKSHLKKFNKGMSMKYK